MDGGWGVGTDVGASELPQVRTKRAGRRFGVGRGLQRTAPSRMKDNPLFAILPRPCLAFWRKTLPVSTSCCLQSAKSFVYSALSVINRRKSSQPGGGGYDGARATKGKHAQVSWLMWQWNEARDSRHDVDSDEAKPGTAVLAYVSKNAFSFMWFLPSSAQPSPSHTGCCSAVTQRTRTAAAIRQPKRMASLSTLKLPRAGHTVLNL